MNTDRDFLKLAVDGAEKDGVLIVCAAGNLDPGEDPKTRDNDAVAQYPASFPNENVIAVANVTEQEQLNSSSHFGLKSVDLGAPGTDIYSTVPTSVNSTGYDSYTGTSMATPHVAAASHLHGVSLSTILRLQGDQETYPRTYESPQLAIREVCHGGYSGPHLLVQQATIHRRRATRATRRGDPEPDRGLCTTTMLRPVPPAESSVLPLSVSRLSLSQPP